MLNTKTPAAHIGKEGKIRPAAAIQIHIKHTDPSTHSGNKCALSQTPLFGIRITRNPAFEPLKFYPQPALAKYKVFCA